MRLFAHGSSALAFFLSLASFIASCGAADYDNSSPSRDDSNDGQAGAAGAAGAAGSAGQAGSALPPEQETESSYQSPVATGRYVWIANPVSGRVAYVDASTLEVRTVNAGNGPTYMAAVPSVDQDAALVINALSQDATLLRALPDGSLSTSTLALVGQPNAWALSPQGHWAVAWTDARAVAHSDPLQGFQDITVLDLSTGTEKAYRLSVGYRPAQVAFAADERHAYAVTQDGISVLQLDAQQGASAQGIVPLSDTPLTEASALDVSISPDGAFALFRREGESTITVVSLADQRRVSVELPAACTDLDLSADGHHAVAALRDAGQLAILPVPEIAANPHAFALVDVPALTVGSVVLAPQAPTAFVFSTATQEERLAAVRLDATPAQVTPVRLHGAVQSVFSSPLGTRALLIHQPIAGAPGAFSVLSLEPALPARIAQSQAPLSAVAITPDGAQAVLAERDDSGRVFGAYLARFSNQQVDRYRLSSAPLAVGVVPQAHRAYIAQQHPEGRLTFIDLESGLARTLTGFELNSRVINGSTP